MICAFTRLTADIDFDNPLTLTLKSDTNGVLREDGEKLLKNAGTLNKVRIFLLMATVA